MQGLRASRLLAVLLLIRALLAANSQGFTPPSRLAPPELLSSNSTSLSISWKPPAEDGGTPIQYYLVLSAREGEPPVPVYNPFGAGEEPSPDVRQFVAGGLHPSTRYVFHVACRNAAGESHLSESRIYATEDPTPMISMAVPSAGPLRGGTRVRLHGADLVWGGVYACRFGDVVVPATLAEAAWPRGWAGRQTRVLGDEGDGRGVVECSSPRAVARTAFSADGTLHRLSAQHVPLALALDGRRFESSEASYTYYASPTAWSLSPASGPLVGGTLVTVTGLFPRDDAHLFGARTSEDFAEAACNFSGAMVRATLVPLAQSHVEVHGVLTLAALPPPAPAPDNVPPESLPPTDMVNRTLLCVAPYIGEGVLSHREY